MNRAKLRKIPVHRDLGAPAAWSTSVGIPRQLAAYNHLGDLDYYDGRFYVPLEGSASAIPVPFGDHEELEGLDIWDLDGGHVPGINGQIHLQMIGHHWWSDDDLYFKHYQVAEPAMKPYL